MACRVFTLEDLHAIDVKAAMGSLPVVLLPLVVEAALLLTPQQQADAFVRSCLQRYGVEVSRDQFDRAVQNLSAINPSILGKPAPPDEPHGLFHIQLATNYGRVGKRGMSALLACHSLQDWRELLPQLFCTDIASAVSHVKALMMRICSCEEPLVTCQSLGLAKPTRACPGMRNKNFACAVAATLMDFLGLGTVGCLRQKKSAGGPTAWCIKKAPIPEKDCCCASVAKGVVALGIHSHELFPMWCRLSTTVCERYDFVDAGPTREALVTDPQSWLLELLCLPDLSVIEERLVELKGSSVCASSSDVADTGAGRPADDGRLLMVSCEEDPRTDGVEGEESSRISTNAEDLGVGRACVAVSCDVASCLQEPISHQIVESSTKGQKRRSFGGRRGVSTAPSEERSGGIPSDLAGGQP